MDPFEDLTAPVDQETTDFNAMVDSLVAAMPRPETMPAAEYRALQASRVPVVRLDAGADREIPGPGGAIPIRTFVPERVDGVYLHIHGGGWIGGANDRADPMLWQRAQEANVAVVSVGYRLAPEHPYPAAPDDCEAAACWVVEHAATEFGTDRIVIGGESAGAHLTAVTLVRMRDRHRYTGFRGAELRYGCYDMRLSPHLRSFTGAYLDAASIAWCIGNFVSADTLEDPDVSPMFADLHGLPPAHFVVGTADSLLDDTLFMYARWRAAGNEARLRVYPGGMHAFDAFPIKIGRRATADVTSFIRERVAG